MNYWSLTLRVSQLCRSKDPRQRKRGFRLRRQLRVRQWQEFNRACQLFQRSIEEQFAPALKAMLSQLSKLQVKK